MLDTNRELVLAIRAGQNVDENYLCLYNKNSRYIMKELLRYRPDAQEMDDFKQQSFLALMEAVHYYDLSGKYYFLTYLKVSLRHHFFEFRRKMQLKISIPNRTFSSMLKGDLEKPVFVDEKILLELPSCDAYGIVEDTVIGYLLWDEIETLLTPVNYHILCEWLDGDSFAEIGRRHNKSRESARRIVQRTLSKLRREVFDEII